MVKLYLIHTCSEYVGYFEQFYNKKPIAKFVEFLERRKRVG